MVRKTTTGKIKDRMDAVIFEGDTAREWVLELSARTTTCIEAAKQSPELVNQITEMNTAKKALIKAASALRPLEGMAARRENGDV